MVNLVWPCGSDELFPVIENTGYQYIHSTSDELQPALQAEFHDSLKKISLKLEPLLQEKITNKKQGVIKI
jgi:hypothetical protein